MDMEAGFLPALDEDQADMFTLSLRLHRHAQDHRLLTQDILDFLFNPSVFDDILGIPVYLMIS